MRKDSQTPVERLQARVKGMSDTDVSQLNSAIEAHKAGDQGAIKRLAERKGDELKALKKLKGVKS